MFGVTNTIKNSDKENWVYSGYGIAFDWAGWWNFGNNFAKNAVIFDIDHREENYLRPVEESANGINGSFGSPEKKFFTNFSKANTKLFFCFTII